MSAAILCEQVELITESLDALNKTVKVVLIKPGWSQNGRYYSRDVLAKAAPLFEGVKAYANHPTREQLQRGDSRSVLDITGDYTNVQVREDGALVAERHVFGAAGEAIWPLIVRSVETKRPTIGISINAAGRLKEGEAEDRKGSVVEDISKANSADDVDAPAAGGEFTTLLMSTDSLTQDLLDTMTYEEFITARPDFIETIRKQLKRERQDEAVRAVSEERDQAHAALVEAHARIADLEQEATTHRTAAEQERRAVALAAVLTEARSKLPAEWHQDIEEELTQAAPDRWAAIVEREVRKARLVKAPVQVSGAGALTPAPVPAPAPVASPMLDMTKFESPEHFAAVVNSRGG